MQPNASQPAHSIHIRVTFISVNRYKIGDIAISGKRRRRNASLSENFGNLLEGQCHELETSKTHGRTDLEPRGQG